MPCAFSLRWDIVLGVVLHKSINPFVINLPAFLVVLPELEQ